MLLISAPEIPSTMSSALGDMELALPEVESLQPRRPMPDLFGEAKQTVFDHLEGTAAEEGSPGDFAAKMNGKYNLSWAMNIGLSQFGMVAQRFSDLIHLDDWTLCGLDASISSSANGLSNDYQLSKLNFSQYYKSINAKLHYK